MQTLSIELAQFTGTEGYHKLSMFGRFVCTDGVQYMAEKAGAYWLIDAIASYQPKVGNEEFQVWNLEVNGNKAVLTMTDGNSKTPMVTQKIGFTDFPESIKLYLVDGVLMLTSEY